MKFSSLMARTGAMFATVGLLVGGQVAMGASPARAADRTVNSLCSIHNVSGLSGYSFRTAKTLTFEVVCPAYTTFTISTIGRPKFPQGGGTKGQSVSRDYVGQGSGEFRVRLTPDNYGRRMNWFVYFNAINPCRQPFAFPHGYMTYGIGVNSATRPLYYTMVDGTMLNDPLAPQTAAEETVTPEQQEADLLLIPTLPEPPVPSGGAI